MRVGCVARRDHRVDDQVPWGQVVEAVHQFRVPVGVVQVPEAQHNVDVEPFPGQHLEDVAAHEPVGLRVLVVEGERLLSPVDEALPDLHPGHVRRSGLQGCERVSPVVAGQIQHPRPVENVPVAA